MDWRCRGDQGVATENVRNAHTCVPFGFSLVDVRSCRFRGQRDIVMAGVEEEYPEGFRALIE